VHDLIEQCRGRTGIDGIRQDDDFGLNSSGYPTRRSPIA
jgi:hypothetical protein